MPEKTKIGECVPIRAAKYVVEGDELTRLRLWRLHRDISKAAEETAEVKGDEKSVDRQLAKAVECLQKTMEGKKEPDSPKPLKS